MFKPAVDWVGAWSGFNSAVVRLSSVLSWVVGGLIGSVSSMWVGNAIVTGWSSDIAMAGASMVGANACCLAISALLSTANATRLDTQFAWFQSSQALFPSGKLAISISRHCSSHYARDSGPSTVFVMTCMTNCMSPDMVIFLSGCQTGSRLKGVIQHLRFLCRTWVALSIHPGTRTRSKC